MVLVTIHKRLIDYSAGINRRHWNLRREGHGYYIRERVSRAVTQRAVKASLSAISIGRRFPYVREREDKWFLKVDRLGANCAVVARYNASKKTESSSTNT